MFLKSFAEFPARKRVGIIAIILGIFSIFAGSPFDRTETKINAKEISLISSNEISGVKVQDLADDIIKSKFDYRLIDLRKQEEYQKYNIPTSENILVSELLTSDLSRNENILLYSDNDIESTQAWFILKSNDFKGVNILEGGLKSWKSKVLFPNCNCGDNLTIEQKHKHDKIAKVSEFFGGKMQNSMQGSTQEQFAMPTVTAPKKVTLKKAKGKRKREGC